MSQTTNAATDPFTLTERLLWFVLEACPDFTDRVTVGRRLKTFAQPRGLEAVKESLAPADLPEVSLYPSGGTGEELRTSSGEGFRQNFTLRVSTGNYRTDGDGLEEIQRGLSAVKWAVVRAFGKWADNFANYPGVRSVTVVPFVDQPDDEQERARGWIGVVTISVLLYWPNMELTRWT